MYVVRLNTSLLVGTCFLLASSFLVTSASAANLTPGQPDPDTAATTFLSKKLEFWQQRMNLTDWKIRVDLARMDQLEPRTLGSVHWDTQSRTAEISVLAPEFYNLAFEPMLDDMEVTIVHELVHIKLASLPHTDASRPVEEHAVHDITAALLQLVRDQRPPRASTD